MKKKKKVLPFKFPIFLNSLIWRTDDKTKVGIDLFNLKIFLFVGKIEKKKKIRKPVICV